MDRVTVLRALGGSLIALAATRPLQTEAGNNAKTCQKKVKQACGKQVTQCEFY